MSEQFNCWIVVSGVVRGYCDARCECGVVRSVYIYDLRSGKSKSCGCVAAKATSERSRRHGLAIHGNRAPEYAIWSVMRDRCRNPRNKGFRNYGGRGIAVCERWDSYENFLADMGPRPSDEHSLDRRNNDGGYNPDNCRWATNAEQARNRRNNRVLTVNGVSKTIADWATEMGIGQRTINARINRLGWSDTDAVTKKPHHRPEFASRRSA